MEKRLGRGLSSLLSPSAPDQGALDLALHEIQPNPFQPRKLLDAGDLEQLRDSILNHGVLQPVVVRRMGEGFQLIAGERRWRAARLAGLEAIPAIVRQAVTDDEMLELALVENVQRRDLNPIEKAEGYRGMMAGLGLTQEAVAKKVGLRRSSVANHLRLLELPQEVREAVARRMLGMGHARALLGLPLREDRIALMEEAVREDLSAREVERRVRAAQGRARSSPGQGSGPLAGEDGQGEAPAADTAESVEVQPWVNEVEDRLRQSLKTKVQVLNSPGFRGKIVIDYFDREQLDSIIRQLAPPIQV